MIRTFITKLFLMTAAAFILFAIPALGAVTGVDANQPYQLLTPIPGIEDSPGSGSVTINEQYLEKYFKTMYRLGIILATGLAVIMIMWGGIEYMTTDAMGGKEEGKERIQSAVMGLLLALGSFIILRTIDPNLVSVKLFIKEVDTSQIKGNITTFDFPELEKNDEGGHGVSGGPLTPGLGVPDQNYYPGSENLAGLDQYRGQGPVAVKDNGGNPGFIDPTIAWLKDQVPSRFSWAVPSSHFRSRAYNTSIGGSATSRHVDGQAIDFFASGGITAAQGDSLTAWLISNAAALGLRQIIFNYKNYTLSNNWSPVRITSMPHTDHVHVGR